MKSSQPAGPGNTTQHDRVRGQRFRKSLEYPIFLCAIEVMVRTATGVLSGRCNPGIMNLELRVPSPGLPAGASGHGSSTDSGFGARPYSGDAGRSRSGDSHPASGQTEASGVRIVPLSLRPFAPELITKSAVQTVLLPTVQRRFRKTNYVFILPGLSTNPQDSQIPLEKGLSHDARS